MARVFENDKSIIEKMRILFFGLINHQHIINFVSSLKKTVSVTCYGINNNPDITNICNNDLFEKVYNVSRKRGIFGGIVKLFSAISCLIRASKNEIDIVQFHYVSFFTLPLVLVAIVKRIKTSVFVYGSDYLRSNTLFHIYIWFVFLFADSIVCDSTALFDELKFKYPKFSKKMECIMFGSAIIDRLSDKQNNRDFYKRQLNLPLDKIVVTCGYNASEAQNHLKIIAALKDYKDKCFFIFPMTYAKDEIYMNKVRSLLSANSIKCLILDSFVPDDLWCEYTAATDIFIHMQKSDAFSSSLAEHLYMGNGVINAVWLKYKELESNSVYFECCDFELLSKVFESMMINIHNVHLKAENNKQIIYELKSLRYCVDKYWSKYFLRLLHE